MTKCKECGAESTVHVTELLAHGTMEHHMCMEHGQHLLPLIPTGPIRLLSFQPEQIVRNARFTLERHLQKNLIEDALAKVVSRILLMGRIDNALIEVPTLLSSLRIEDSCSSTCRNNSALCAAYALHLVDADSHAAVPGLIRSLNDRFPVVRAYSALSLGLIGPMAAPGKSALRAALEDEDELVRTVASRSLDLLLSSR